MLPALSDIQAGLMLLPGVSRRARAARSARGHQQATSVLAIMLVVLLSGFALSQAFRTVTAIMAPDLQASFGLDARALGAFAGLFGISFGLAQLLMGMGLDVYGLRPTVLIAQAFAMAGAVLSAMAPGYGWLMLGQLMIGLGCSPAFLACAIFIARHLPAERFAFYSGLSLGSGGLGLLFTGTPLAWVVDQWGWRSGFWVLAILTLISWLFIFMLVHEPVRDSANQQPAANGWASAFAGFAKLLTLPHTWGILVLGLSCYAAFLSLRGLWLGPLLIDRYGFSLVDSGNVAVALSFISLFTPGVFGRMDPGPQRRRAWIANAALLMAGLFLLLALVRNPTANVVLIVLMGLLSGYTVLQYADVRSSYPSELTGRALSLFTMALFLGVALMQWFTGIVGSWAQALGVEPYLAIMLTIAFWLGAASFAFRWLPASALLAPQRDQSAG